MLAGILLCMLSKKKCPYSHTRLHAQIHHDLNESTKVKTLAEVNACACTHQMYAVKHSALLELASGLLC